MKRSIRRTPDAFRDLDQAAQFLAQQSLELQVRFFAEAEATFDQIVRMPGLGTSHEFADPRIRGVRIWPIRGFRNYLVFYRELDDGILIVRVLHATRDWEAIIGS